ncbi:DExH-box ATP-dependent RNA helicase DExH17 isoform X2 [Rhodamnia argentea]|uniref:DNA 3'-5' helicase n=1 Tax=Rhodamnia argentea TaxID=178133 RepID=A0ABM3HUB5_9MYRT|nr:DExH-box ATP-dependent RNA helicase DExH17 isoform X2 [Rhodamnia argentea]
MDLYTLKSVSDLPPPFRSIYSFRYFNSLQSECFPSCFHSDINMVISAPTGSGKTVLFELCILRLLSRFITDEMKFIHTKGTLKTIYIAPSKALVQEKLRDWSQKFGSWGINCLELTGDNDAYKTRNIQEADIILTTPEKFDAVTRYRIKDGGLSFFSDIALLLIDEVHLLNDTRGAALEAIVSRIKILASNPNMKLTPLAHVRLLAVSATIPNIEDLAEWLMVPAQGIKRFGEEMRPVKLTTRVLGYTPAKNDFLFEQRLQNFIFDILMQYSKGKSALVFCSTRKGAQEAAQRLSQMAMTFGYSNPFIKNKEQQESLREASLSCSDKQMQSYIIYGVAYHHGGLGLKDRNLVEGLFLKGDIQVLCTTNTLAHGINLPAHTVVIKSTRNFNKEKGLYVEYDRTTVLQMCGRAGRPPFDDTGMVIIMTRKETVHLYENLLSGCETVESQLLSCVTEHLTAEIVQLTVTDITRAIEWMKCSYLYVRMKKDPGKYAIKKGITNNQIEKHMQEICLQKVHELSQHQMIWMDEDGFLLKPLEPGHLMTKYYLKFDTMKYIMEAPANCSLEDALHVVCHAEELAWIQLRRNEKKLLNDINADKDGRLRFHIIGDKGKPKKRIQTREEKIFILTNDFLTGDPLVRDMSMTQDMNSILPNGSRVAKCLKDYFLYKKNYVGAVNSARLAKSLHQKLWDDSKYLLKQLPGIGMVTAKALLTMGIDSFEKLHDADPRRIEIVTGRKYPFGNQIKESLQSLPPKVEIKAEEIECERQGKAKVSIMLTRLLQSVLSNKGHYADMIVGSEEDNCIHFHKKISPYNTTVYVSCPRHGKLTIKADLIFEEYLGIDLHNTFQLKENQPNTDTEGEIRKPSSFPPSGQVGINCNSKSTSNAIARSFHNFHKSKSKSNSGPSFDLIDEDSVESITKQFTIFFCLETLISSFQSSDMFLLLGNEGEPTKRDDDDDDCKIISETTVFDHIREKAKCFPALTTSSSSCSPSRQLLDIQRKRSREKPLKLPELIEIQEETEGWDTDDDLYGCDADDHSSSKQHFADAFSVAANPEGGFPSKPKENASVALNEETVFNHIRKKSKNLPVLTGLKMSEPKPLIGTKEHSFEEQPHHIISKDFLRDDTSISNTERIQVEKDPRHTHSLGVSRTSIDISAMKMLLFDSPTAKKNATQDDPRESPEACKKPDCSRARLTVGKTKAMDSCLGFRSIFSFL